MPRSVVITNEGSGEAMRMFTILLCCSDPSPEFDRRASDDRKTTQDIYCANCDKTWGRITYVNGDIEELAQEESAAIEDEIAEAEEEKAREGLQPRLTEFLDLMRP